jgi:hypothetical protein
MGHHRAITRNRARVAAVARRRGSPPGRFRRPLQMGPVKSILAPNRRHIRRPALASDVRACSRPSSPCQPRASRWLRGCAIHGAFPADRAGEAEERGDQRNDDESGGSTQHRRFLPGESARLCDVLHASYQDAPKRRTGPVTGDQIPRDTVHSATAGCPRRTCMQSSHTKDTNAGRGNMRHHSAPQLLHL